jgi:hypothetical protein
MGFIQDVLKDRYGFITEKDFSKVAAENRLQPCLVRCCGGRFIAPAQDVEHFIKLIGKDGSEYVRDVSIYTGALS